MFKSCDQVLKSWDNMLTIEFSLSYTKLAIKGYLERNKMLPSVGLDLGPLVNKRKLCMIKGKLECCETLMYQKKIHQQQ